MIANVIGWAMVVALIVVWVAVVYISSGERGLIWNAVAVLFVVYLWVAFWLISP